MQNGLTVLNCAANKGNANVVRMLLDAGAAVNVTAQVQCVVMLRSRHDDVMCVV